MLVGGPAPRKLNVGIRHNTLLLARERAVYEGIARLIAQCNLTFSLFQERATKKLSLKFPPPPLRRRS